MDVLPTLEKLVTLAIGLAPRLALHLDPGRLQNAPLPTAATQVFIIESRRAAKQRRLQMVGGILLVATVVGLGTAGWANRVYLKHRTDMWADFYWTRTILSHEKERALKSRHEFQECRRCPVMVVDPADDYTMRAMEPHLKVTFAKPFAVSKIWVTFEEWNTCAVLGGCTAKPRDRGEGGEKKPITNVSWDDAKEYADWLSKETGNLYRLLSEAEWEYASRVFSLGDVRHGNSVWEWVEDCYADSYNGTPRDGSTTITGDCSSRVVRNSSWYFNPDTVRRQQLTIRDKATLDVRTDYLGFRLGRTIAP